MNVLGCIASVTQLAAYSRQAARRLEKLYKAAQDGPIFCREQRTNIRLLNDLIQLICKDEASNIDVILPLLIATASLANSLLNLLQSKGTFYNHWLWISKGQEIESGFGALNDKTRLLQLHVAERTCSIVTNVQKDIRDMNRSIKDTESHLGQSPPPSTSQELARKSPPNSYKADPSATTPSSIVPLNESHVDRLPPPTLSTAIVPHQAHKTSEAESDVTSPSSTVPAEPRTAGNTQVKLDSCENEVEGQYNFGNGWSKNLKDMSSLNMTSNTNKVKVGSQYSAGNADATPMDISWQRKADK